MFDGLRTRWQVTVVMLAVVAAFGVVTVQAGSEQVRETFTGCLNHSSGSLTSLAPGDDPLRPCAPNEMLVRLGSGDITAVHAGEGLSGGGSSDEVLLAVEETYRLPQGCVTGQVAKVMDDLWGCAADEDTTYSGTDFATSDQSCALGEVVTGIGDQGVVVCAPDQDTTYGGDDFALSGQACPAGQVMNGISSTGVATCTSTLAAGDYSINLAALGGITITGPNGAIVLGPGGVTVTGTLVTINGPGCPAARVGDTVALGGVGTIITGSPTVLIGGNC